MLCVVVPMVVSVCAHYLPTPHVLPRSDLPCVTDALSLFYSSSVPRSMLLTVLGRKPTLESMVRGSNLELHLVLSYRM
jgi:hypothetical protein